MGEAAKTLDIKAMVVDRPPDEWVCHECRLDWTFDDIMIRIEVDGNEQNFMFLCRDCFRKLINILHG